jgi:hypothetical protein
MPKFDAGERFDLRSPYADDGWVVSGIAALRLDLSKKQCVENCRKVLRGS